VDVTHATEPSHPSLPLPTELVVIRVTLDTNVIISGLVFRGKPNRILQMAAEGEFEAFISDPR
jgi:hypothetical protein